MKRQTEERDQRLERFEAIVDTVGKRIIPVLGVGLALIATYVGYNLATNPDCQQQTRFDACFTVPLEEALVTDPQVALRKDVKQEIGKWTAPLFGDYEIMTYTAAPNAFEVIGNRDYYEDQIYLGGPTNLAWFSQELRPMAKDADLRARAPFSGQTRVGNDKTSGYYVDLTSLDGKFMCRLANLDYPAEAYSKNSDHGQLRVAQGEVLGKLNKNWRPTEKVTGATSKQLSNQLDQKYPQHAGRWANLGIGCIHIDETDTDAVPTKASVVPFTLMVKPMEMPKQKTAWGFRALTNEPNKWRFPEFFDANNALIDLARGK